MKPAPPCPACGYNLAGLAGTESITCPECGAAVTPESLERSRGRPRLAWLLTPAVAAAAALAAWPLFMAHERARPDLTLLIEPMVWAILVIVAGAIGARMLRRARRPLQATGLTLLSVLLGAVVGLAWAGWAFLRATLGNYQP